MPPQRSGCKSVCFPAALWGANGIPHSHGRDIQPLGSADAGARCLHPHCPPRLPLRRDWTLLSVGGSTHGCIALREEFHFTTSCSITSCRLNCRMSLPTALPPPGLQQTLKRLAPGPTAVQVRCSTSVPSAAAGCFQACAAMYDYFTFSQSGVCCVRAAHILAARHGRPSSMSYSAATAPCSLWPCGAGRRASPPFGLPSPQNGKPRAAVTLCI